MTEKIMKALGLARAMGDRFGRKLEEITSAEKIRKPILVTLENATEALRGAQRGRAVIIVSHPHRVATIRLMFPDFDGPVIPVGGSVEGYRFDHVILAGGWIWDEPTWVDLALVPRMKPGCFVGELVGAA